MEGDWHFYVETALAVLRGQNPYVAVPEFLHPPWTLPVLLALFWLPLWGARLLPTIVLFYLAYKKRKPYLIAIVGTSFAFIALSVYANLDWLPMLGAGIGGWLGALLVTMKPQSGAFAVLGDMRGKSWRELLRLFAPLAVALVVGTLIYTNWISHMFTARSMEINKTHNFSLFPYSIPVGIWAMWQAWRLKSRAWGVFASLCIAPYFYIGSMTPLVYVVAEKNWKAGLALNLFTWALVALILLGVLQIKL